MTFTKKAPNKSQLTTRFRRRSTNVCRLLKRYGKRGTHGKY